MQILVYLVMILLSACSYVNQYLNENAQTTKCKQICRQHWRQCGVDCKRDAMHCAVAQSNAMAREYAVYMQQQIVQGRSIALEQDAFRDPLFCRKLTCDCDADKLVCMQICAGKIRQRLEPV